jgi:ribonuclease G
LLKSGLADALAEVMVDPEDVEMHAGYIIRTAAEFSDYHDFVADVRYLKRLWRALQKKMAVQSTPALIYEDLNVCERTMRDFVYPELEKIRVDSRPVYERLIKFAKEFIPEFVDKIEIYDSSRPIFDLFSVEDEITKALVARCN